MAFDSFTTFVPSESEIIWSSSRDAEINSVVISSTENKEIILQQDYSTVRLSAQMAHLLQVCLWEKLKEQFQNQH